MIRTSKFSNGLVVCVARDLSQHSRTSNRIKFFNDVPWGSKSKHDHYFGII